MKQGEHDDFTWFGLSECNILRPQDEFTLFCVFFKLALNWPKRTWLKSVASQSLYNAELGSYMQPQGPTGGHRVINFLLQQLGFYSL
jgi:hypothetical protein